MTPTFSPSGRFPTAPPAQSKSSSTSSDTCIYEWDEVFSALVLDDNLLEVHVGELWNHADIILDSFELTGF
jgi:hypothetical protein